jgi:hypothetical protein
MKSWQILSDSILRVFNNLGAAIMISLVPYIIAIVIAAALWLPIGFQVLTDQAAMQSMMQAGQFPWLQFLVTILAFAIAGLWIAVAWHRFVLLDERPGWIPPFRGDRMWAYFLRGLLIAIILIPVIIVASIILGIVIGGLAQGNAFFAVVLAVLIGFVLWLIGLRLGTALPGAAIKPGTTIGDAWRATAGQWGMFAALAIMLAVLSAVIGLVGSLLAGVPILSVIWSIVFNWISTMVGLSILTTLWGHYVEGRALS